MCKFAAWDNAPWETTFCNPDTNLVDPRTFRLPPIEPTDPEVTEFAEAIQRRAEDLCSQNPPFAPVQTLGKISLPAALQAPPQLLLLMVGKDISTRSIEQSVVRAS
jgi:hypothetical protein